MRIRSLLFLRRRVRGIVSSFARSFLLLVPLLVACEIATAPLPNGAERFDPPTVYAQWWSLTEGCSGLTGDLADAAWYRVPGAADLPFNGESSVGGIWYPEGNRIVLAGDQQFAGDLVRHEMLHALLKSAGHPRAAFIDKCDGTLVCTGACVTESDPAPQPDPTADSIPPSALEVEMEVTPAAPSSRVNDGNFMMVLSVRNNASTPVIAMLPSSGGSGPPLLYGYSYSSGSSGAEYDLPLDSPEQNRFAAHEVKHMIFDFHVVAVASDNRYEVAPGTYTFAGGYGGVAAAHTQVIVVSP